MLKANRTDSKTATGTTVQMSTPTPTQTPVPAAQTTTTPPPTTRATNTDAGATGAWISPQDAGAWSEIITCHESGPSWYLKKYKKCVDIVCAFHNSKTLCPSGLRGWTQVPLARAAWVQIPQVSWRPWPLT